MTAWEIARREVARQVRRPSTWLAFAALVIVAFLLVRGGSVSGARSTDFFLNSPFVVAIITVAGGLIWLLVARGAGAWQPLGRSAPVGKATALGGQFVATLALNALILLAAPAGILLALLAPGAEAGRQLPFSPAAYLASYAFIAVPSAAIATAVHCALAALRGARRQLAVGVLVALAMVASGGLVKFKSITDIGGRVPVAPFRIADNLHYVGTTDVTAFLLAGPEGHILIDGGYPGTAALITENITTLGFDIADVKIILNSHAHFDHAGGLAALQAASGAELWVSAGDADIVASGGAGDPTLGPLNALVHAGLVRYPAPRVDHRFADGATIRLGSLAVTARVTAGHTPGCTTWSFPVQVGDRELRAVSVCSLTLPPGAPESYPGMQTDFEQSFTTLRNLPADIFLASHAGAFELERKLRERPAAENPVTPFIDREGYRNYIDDAEKRFRAVLNERP
jgi:metallo-beta-lactamase class B